MNFSLTHFANICLLQNLSIGSERMSGKQKKNSYIFGGCLWHFFYNLLGCYSVTLFYRFERPAQPIAQRMGNTHISSNKKRRGRRRRIEKIIFQIH